MKITKKGTNLEATFKVDDVNYSKNRIDRYFKSVGKDPLHCPGVLKSGSVEIKGTFGNLIPHEKIEILIENEHYKENLKFISEIFKWGESLD